MNNNTARMENASGNKDLGNWTILLAFAVVSAGLISVFIYASQFGWRRSAWSVVSVGLATAASSLLGGGLLGFLFGIPRTLQNERPPASSTADKSKDPARTDLQYQPNTNLEQISDWLTKILVGVGLTQLPEINTNIRRLVRFLAPALGDVRSSAPFALTLMASFSVAGFLIGFLWTRLRLPGALRGADLQKLTDAIDELKAQSQIDATALALTTAQLGDPTPGRPLSADELSDAIKRASAPMKVQIFDRAWQLRNSTWRDNKAEMERTIPIFRALAEADTERRFHRNYAQLGFALKDSRRPDWRAAQEALSQAIEIRGPWRGSGWEIYEVNRAMCKIKQDPDFNEGRESSNDARRSILEDLEAAGGLSREQRNAILRDDPIGPWLDLNHVPVDSLGRSKLRS